MAKIKLGNEVRCKYTGFKGIAVARTEYINGCVQFTVAPRVGKDNKFTNEEIFIDEESLEIVTKTKRKKVKPTGGKTRIAHSIRRY